MLVSAKSEDDYSNRTMQNRIAIVNSMRNSLAQAAPENAKQAVSGGFAAPGKSDFELIHYISTILRHQRRRHGK